MTVLRSCAIPLSEPLTHLFNVCMNTSSIPSQWKHHLIVPVFKSGDRTQVSNYRPISLLSTASKVLERLIYDKIIDFIQPQISHSQFGFLRNHSPIHKLLSSTSTIMNAVNNKEQADVLFLDLQKAFDSIPHGELLYKLRSIGVCGALLQWFQHYLKDRFHSVSIHGSQSSLLPVISGVLQGSILGPLLFLVYINDITTVATSSQLLLFADDSQCLKTIQQDADCQLLQSDLDAMCSWASTWKLTFNALKCKHIHFGSSSFTSTYNINRIPLVSVSDHKDLGITISKDLSFSIHLNRVLSKFKMLGLTISPNCPVSIKRTLYLTLVRSQITYCCQIWRPHLLRECEQLERLQRRATKFILGNYYIDYKSRLTTLNLLPLSLWMEMQDILLFVKLNQSPPANFSISDYISFVSPSIATRSTTVHKIKSNSKAIPRLNSTRHFYLNRIIRLWNSLPQIPDLDQSFADVKRSLLGIYWNYFTSSFSTENTCSWYRMCPCSKCMSLPM